jgi:hypothetical protein
MTGQQLTKCQLAQLGMEAKAASVVLDRAKPPQLALALSELG